MHGIYPVLGDWLLWFMVERNILGLQWSKVEKLTMRSIVTKLNFIEM